MRKLNWWCYRSFLLFLILMAYASPLIGQEQPGVKITYIANAGVMIQCSGKTVLIDAHHNQGNPIYERLSWQILEKMVNSMKPFPHVDLILATHIHADHFEAKQVGRHLLGSKSTKFLGSAEMTAMIERDFPEFDTIKGQIETITPDIGFTNEIAVNGIEVKLLGMKHGGKAGDLLNVGYIIKIGKYSFLHIGDADTTPENFAPFKLPNEGLDFAFIPYWFFVYDQFDAVVQQHLQAGVQFAVHIPPAELAEVTQKVHAKYPNAVVFSKSMQTVAF